MPCVQIITPLILRRLKAVQINKQANDVRRVKPVTTGTEHGWRRGEEDGQWETIEEDWVMICGSKGVWEDERAAGKELKNKEWVKRRRVCNRSHSAFKTAPIKELSDTKGCFPLFLFTISPSSLTPHPHQTILMPVCFCLFSANFYFSLFLSVCLSVCPSLVSHRNSCLFVSQIF